MDFVDYQIAEDVMAVQEVRMQERYDENMEERAIQQVEYDRAVDYDYQVERNNMVEQYEIDRQIDRAENNYVENQYLMDREIQREERVEEDRMIENAAYNQYVAQENAEIVREEMFVAQDNYAVNNFQRAEIARQDARIIQNSENAYINEQMAKNQLELQQAKLELQRMQNSQPPQIGFSQSPQLVEGRFESPMYYSSFFEWKEGIGSIANAEVAIGEKSIRLNELAKIKLMKETAVNGSRKIKLSHITHDILFSVQPKSVMGTFPLHYYWFAKIITEKLYLKGYDLANPYIPERTYTNSSPKNIIIDGILYKQSQYLKSWELRYIAITPEGLFSYKEENGAESFTIKRESATELWTRFDIHEKMLVIKVHHNSRKTEFGIPIVDYCQESNVNWLHAFYRLVYP